MRNENFDMGDKILYRVDNIATYVGTVMEILTAIKIVMIRIYVVNSCFENKLKVPLKMHL